jgi:RNA polymerase sigma factor (sigma-70 family)
MELTWRQFVMTHAEPLTHTAWKVLGNEADAEETVQEVFLEVFRGKRFAQLHHEPALLKTMATRRALDCLRRRKPTVLLEAQEHQGTRSDPLESLIAKETEQRIRERLPEMAPREAEVFCLICFENRSHSEVAALLGISTGAVAKALCKARERLSESLLPNSDLAGIATGRNP